MGWNVEIDEEKCTGDEECVNVCPSAVLEMEGGKAVVANTDECLGCESCVEVCPSGAITVTEVKLPALEGKRWLHRVASVIFCRNF